MADYTPHSQLLRLRNSMPPDDPRQQQLAALEHQAFAREWTQENPMLAIPSLAVAIPGYTMAKLLGMTHARSRGSLHEIATGYRGVGQGLAALLNRS